jgi:membrane protein DedA with SNARE-associated domain
MAALLTVIAAILAEYWALKHFDYELFLIVFVGIAILAWIILTCCYYFKARVSSRFRAGTLASFVLTVSFVLSGSLVWQTDNFASFNGFSLVISLCLFTVLVYIPADFRHSQRPSSRVLTYFKARAPLH